MLGTLPKSLEICGKEYPIQTDFRLILIVIQAFNDDSLSREEQTYIMLDAMLGIENITNENIEDAVKKCVWFIDGGLPYNKANSVKLMDWKQDEQILFSSINNVARKEIRELDYLHWWSFLGYFNEIKDGLFSSVLLIRQKKAKGKKLDKSEQEFYRANKEMIDFSTKETEQIKQEKEELLNELKQFEQGW